MTALRIDLVASLSHYRDHLLPIWDCLPGEVRGNIRLGADASQTPPRNRVCMVASWRDMAPLRGATQFIYVEHGSGQNYSGDPKSAHWPDYAGPGRMRHMDVLAYISPSQRVADLWQHPRAFAVGSPKLDAWLNDDRQMFRKDVCFVFHWPCKVAPESDTAFWDFAGGLPDVFRSFMSQGWGVYAHTHPKWEGEIDPVLTGWGAKLISADDAARCEVMVCDNSSLMYEAAALGAHIIALNASGYRRDVHHGLRFWDAVPGLQVDEPEALAAVQLDLLVSSKSSAMLRDQAVAYAYAHADGKSAQRAADAILSVLD